MGRVSDQDEESKEKLMSSRFTERAFSRDFRAKWASENEGTWKKDRAKRWVWEGVEKDSPKKIVKPAAPKVTKKRVFKTKVEG